MQLTRALRRSAAASSGAAALACLACATLGHARAQERPTTLSADALVYTDTDNVLVVTTQAAAARAFDEGGGQASVSAVIDVVSAASVDVVSQASKRFDEVRGELNVGVSRAFGDALPSINYRGSTEPDYVSHGFGAGFLTRLGGADTVASAHYQITFDTVGRSGTPFSTYSRALTTQSADLSLTQNLSTRALLRGVYSFTLQDGYMEKPYRFVPLFDAGGLQQAASDGVALDLDTFDAYRLAARPPEEVPDLRVRQAIGLRGLYHVDAIGGSLRADYRFYFDDWGVLAHSAELALELPVSELTTLGFFSRGYTQSAASFYRATYVVAQPQEVPRLRTVDRKLAPYDMLTLGARVELHSDAITTYFEASASYSSFHEYIYLDQVIALIGQGGFAWSF